MDSHKQLDAYDVTQYDEVVVIISPNSKLRENYPDLVKHDKSRDRYYVKGKLVKLKLEHTSNHGYSYPVHNAIALVPSSDILAFNKATKGEQKRKYIVNIFFADIKFIVLDFDSLDWLK